MEEKKQRGGARKGAGRKTKRDEEKVVNIFNKAIKEIFSTDNEDEAKTELIKDLFKFSRGKMFIAEHVFGKPKENVDLNVNKIPDLSELTSDEIRDLLNESE